MCKSMCAHPKMKALGLLGLRIAVGVIFMYTGYSKLGPHHDGASMMFSGMGLPGSAGAYFVGLLEFVGGLMVLLGVFAGTAAMWLSVIMVVAILSVHRGGPFMGYFLPMAVLGGCLALIGSGAGCYRLVKLQCPCPKCRAMEADGGACGTDGSCGSGMEKAGCCGGACGGSCGDKMMGCACGKADCPECGKKMMK